MTSTLEDLLAELNKDPEFRKEYQRQKPYYDQIIESTIKLKVALAECDDIKKEAIWPVSTNTEKVLDQQ